MSEVAEELRNLNSFSVECRWSVWSWRCPQRFEKLDENPMGEVTEEAGGEGRKLGGEDSIGLGLSRRESTRCRSLASRERSE